MSGATDAQLVARSIGNPEAFGEVYDRHAPALMRYLVRRVGPDPGEGLLGELFRIAFERRGSFDLARASAAPWLYGIATNLLLKHRRSEARRLRAVAELRLAQPDGAGDEAELLAGVDARERLPRLADAIAALPDGERDALVLYAWEGLGYDAIAEALGTPVGTVRSRLSRARARLRELDGPSGKEPGETAPRVSGRREP